jgi:hypothetical protein
MTLPLPNLDNRQWIDLVGEGRALIRALHRIGPITTLATRVLL